MRSRLRNQPREDQAAVKRIHRGRDRLAIPFIKDQPGLLAQFIVTNGDQSGQQQRRFRHADKGIADRPERAVVGRDDQTARQRHPVRPPLSQHTRHQRIGKILPRRDAPHRRAMRAQRGGNCLSGSTGTRFLRNSK